MDFGGKRALVTGAGRGIGKAIAFRLAELGAEVVALANIQSDLDEVAKENPKIKTLFGDLSNWQGIRDAIQSILPIHLLVNNAGIYIPESFLNATEQKWDLVMNINLKAIVNVSQVICNDLVNRKEPGSIVNISSAASHIGIQAGADAITRVMALELGTHNIRVNTLNPTVILTDMGRLGWSDPNKANPLLNRIPLHRFGEVDDAVNAVVFLLSDQAKFITGTHLRLDGGLLST